MRHLMPLAMWSIGTDLKKVFGLSEEIYINTKDYSPSVTPIIKDGRFDLTQCSKNELKREKNTKHLIWFCYWSLLYDQICIRRKIAFFELELL